MRCMCAIDGISVKMARLGIWEHTAPKEKMKREKKQFNFSKSGHKSIERDMRFILWFA